MAALAIAVSVAFALGAFGDRAEGAANVRNAASDRVLSLENHRLELIDLETDQERAIAPGLSFESATLSLDGTQVAGNEVNRRGLVIVKVASGATKRITSGDDRDPTWSPDGKWLAFARGDGEPPLKGQGLYVIRPIGTDLRLVKPGVVSTPAWSPSGGQIAFDLWTVNAWDAANEQWLHTKTSLAEIAPSGKSLRRLTVHSWKPARQGIDDLDPIWSPNSSLIAFQRTAGAGDSGGSSVYMIKASGSSLRRISPAGYFAEPTSWSPDSAQLADWRSKTCSACASSGPMQAWVTNVATGSGSSLGSFASVIWSPSGKVVAFGCDAAPSGACVVDSGGTVLQSIAVSKP